MDPSLTSGVIIATIGIGTVFFALVTLIALVTAMARLMKPAESDATEPVSGPAPSTHATPSPAPDAAADKESSLEVEAPEPDFEKIALSAYAYHRRTTTRIASDVPSTSWGVAGRVHETTRRANTN